MDRSERPKRTSNACKRCRSRKVKCSGTHPCDKCRQRRQDCVFEDDRKIVVSEDRRILNTIQARLSPHNSTPLPLAVDGDAYQLQWRQASSEELPDISGLPSLEHAIYILNTVQFHFSHLYLLFDEDEFLRHLYEFYDNAEVKVQESRLWYVQFLIVLAFGEALLAPVRKVSNAASWTKYFLRAMSFLPDITGLWQDPVLAIEVLTLIGLYFHSIDMRDTAYCYIGHAMRMALVEGHHRAPPVEQLGQKLVDRCQNIWWTVYILDRKFSSLIGSPNAVKDHEITTPLYDPKSCHQKEAALSLHVRITQVITRVLDTRGHLPPKGSVSLAGNDGPFTRVGGCLRASIFKFRRIAIWRHYAADVILPPMHHRHYPTTRLSPALGTTQLLRARRGVPNFIITSTDPSARIYRLRIKIIKNPNRAT
ncbi:hypothetical protein AO1008_04535 [Aspergillus oryzae 100-8]|uniref:Zn(2)-C6 fungal-type domain-containing protein n=1 Tax=Aspergillus oryzae (strain 3.042) TaxID=1160506 RepID=I7ZND3_ASPO3|nr:hypothetical protein Ao3042_10618 [Aspergillus oryzae 3.042]KDE78160.1 hypothetical protein AO1008_04535 [Aspergillus oryzae 100-8]|eukprot:EIT73337.1 hypothetical protein Ao3042_10618 [Aspergillus oryzae 3.042]